MAINKKLGFNKRQLKCFAIVLRKARLSAGLSQMKVATLAFDYSVSHCKVSRVERCAMKQVDAYAIGRIADVLKVPVQVLTKIDPMFSARRRVATLAGQQGFWNYPAM